MRLRGGAGSETATVVVRRARGDAVIGDGLGYDGGGPGGFVLRGWRGRLASEESLAVRGGARPAPRSFREGGGASTARAAGGMGGELKRGQRSNRERGGSQSTAGVLPEMPSERDPRACPSELGSAHRVLNNAGHTNRSANGSREILQMPVSVAYLSVLIGPLFCRPPAPKRFTRCHNNIVPLKKKC